MELYVFAHTARPGAYSIFAAAIVSVANASSTGAYRGGQITRPETLIPVKEGTKEGLRMNISDAPGYGGHLFLNIEKGYNMIGLRRKLFAKEPTSNLFVKVWSGDTLLSQSPVASNTTSPNWQWSVGLVLKPEDSTVIVLEILDDPNTLLGETSFDVQDMDIAGSTKVFSKIYIDPPQRKELKRPKDFLQTKPVPKKGGVGRRGQITFRANFFRNKYEAGSVHRMAAGSEMRIMYTGKPYYIRHEEGIVTWSRPLLSDDEARSELGNKNKLGEGRKKNKRDKHVTIAPEFSDTTSTVLSATAPSSPAPSERKGGRFLRQSMYALKAPPSPGNRSRADSGMSTSTVGAEAASAIPGLFAQVQDVPWKTVCERIEILRSTCRYSTPYHKAAARGVSELCNFLFKVLEPVATARSRASSPGTIRSSSPTSPRRNGADTAGEQVLSAIKLRLCLVLNQAQTLAGSFQTRASISMLLRNGSPVSILRGLEAECSAIISNLCLVGDAVGITLNMPGDDDRQPSRDAISTACDMYARVFVRIREHGGSRNLLKVFIDAPWHLQELSSMLEMPSSMDLQNEIDLWLIEQTQHEARHEAVLGQVLQKHTSRRNAAPLDSDRMLQMILMQRNQKEVDGVESSGESASDSDDDYTGGDGSTVESGSDDHGNDTGSASASESGVGSLPSLAQGCPRSYHNDAKLWNDFFGPEVEMVSVDHMVSVLNIVYTPHDAVGADAFGVLAEMLDPYPYMGLVTYEDWASLHRMMRLSGMIPKEFLKVLVECLGEDEECCARTRIPAAPTASRRALTVPEVPNMTRLVHCSDPGSLAHDETTPAVHTATADPLRGGHCYGTALSMHMPLYPAGMPRYFRAVMGRDATEIMRPAKVAGMRRQSIFQQSKAPSGGVPLRKKRCISFIAPTGKPGDPLFPVPLYSTTLHE